MATSNSDMIHQSYPTITPYLMVNGAPQLIDFLKAAFDAEEITRQLRPDGTIAHAEVKIRESFVMLSEASKTYPSTRTMIYVHLNECDSYYKRAIDAGAESIMEPKDQEYGDRMSGVKDILGNQWWIATSKKK